MDKKDITFADVSRSLNRLDGFIDDFLLTVQSYNEKRIIENANVIVGGHKETMVIYPIDIKKSIIGFIDDVKFNREGDESINYYGVHDCVDYILNNQSLLLAKRAFSIETKIKEAEQILLSFLSEIEETSDLLWQTGQILWQIGELHIEPFVIDDENDGNYPEIPKELKNLFPNESQCVNFVKRNYGKTAAFVAHAYLDEHRVIHPSDANKSIPVIAILFRYFVEPYIKGEKEKETARTGFYTYFKIK